MKSIILRTASRFLMPMILLFSAFLLLRGHNLPGGGFVGGLMAASAFTLYTFAFSPAEARLLLRADPRSLIGVGLLLALGSGIAALAVGQPFLTGQWGTLTVPQWGSVKIGTPLLFDLGIYLVVMGATLAMILSMAEKK
ncbi:MAG: Na+/H+ antiporter subunit B [Desulfuromonadales bacterium]|nr:Na+/H+ antiporter subunit B [Desulfuromonadales bacterium]NIS42317.1 Na+/H+ antiporter subunit B [Desulfuromonadales bacterium]